MHINLMIAVFIVAISASIILKNITIISYINILGTVLLLVLSFLIGLDVANSGHVFYFGSNRFNLYKISAFAKVGYTFEHTIKV